MSFLVIAALLGLIPAFIAQSKGRSFGGWWLYGFLLFIVAIIHVLFVPSLNSSGAAVADSQGPVRDCHYRQSQRVPPLGVGYSGSGSGTFADCEAVQ